MIEAIIHALGAIGGGSESSPLSVESPFSEIIRLVQIGIFAGILYLIRGLKEAKGEGVQAHSTMARDLETIRDEMKAVRGEVSTLQEQVGKQ